MAKSDWYTSEGFSHLQLDKNLNKPEKTKFREVRSSSYFQDRVCHFTDIMRHDCTPHGYFIADPGLRSKVNHAEWENKLSAA